MQKNAVLYGYTGKLSVELMVEIRVWSQAVSLHVFTRGRKLDTVNTIFTIIIDKKIKKVALQSDPIHYGLFITSKETNQINT